VKENSWFFIIFSSQTDWHKHMFTDPKMCVEDHLDFVNKYIFKIMRLKLLLLKSRELEVKSLTFVPPPFKKGLFL